MKAVCDTVTERVAIGEPLAELADHVTTCEGCQQIVAMPSKLGAGHHAIDPGLGFSARMTVGAQHRIAVRRRNRIAGTLAVTVAASALGVFVVTRSPADPQDRAAVEIPDNQSDEKHETPVAAEQADLETLVRLADTKRARRVSAPWGRIQKPLAPYMKLVKGVTP